MHAVVCLGFRDLWPGGGVWRMLIEDCLWTILRNSQRACAHVSPLKVEGGRFGA